MLLEAKRAGDALLAAKKMVKHGEFKAWVEANCRCSYPTANYMTVAKNAARCTFDPEMSIRAFLEAHSTPRTTKPIQSEPEVMAREDAEYLLKLHAMATRGSPNEQVIAQAKVDSFSQQFALSPEAAIAQAKALLPDNDKSTEQRTQDEKLRKAEARLAEVEAKLERMMSRKAELRSQFTGLSYDELLEMLVDLHLQLDPPV